MALQRKDVQEVVRNYLKTNDFEVISYRELELNGVATGFQSNAEKTRIKFKTSRGEEELDVFIKVIPKSPFHRGIVMELGTFDRECILYNEVFNGYHDSLRDHSIPACYLARPDIQVLEDLSKKGFKNRPLYETLDLQHCEKVMETLAKFHAFSFITEKREGRKMVEIVPIIKTDSIMSTEKDHVGRKYGEATIRSVKKIVEECLGQLPSAPVKKAFHYLDNCFEELRSSKLYPNVLSHSDMWSSNIMFSYDEHGGVAEACLVDFQLVTYRAPGYDIQLFLYCCTSNELRENKMDHLMRLYYTELTRVLRCSDIDIEDLMSWEDFQNMLQETLPISLAQGALILAFVLIPERILKKARSSDEKFKMYYVDDRIDYILEALENDEYKSRIIPAITNFINYFNNER